MNAEDKEKYKKKLKNIFNNKPTIIFSILALIILLTSLISFFKININFLFLQQIIYSFSAGNLLFLGLMLTCSATLAHFKKFNLMFLPILLWLLITTVTIRTQNISGLKDVTTGDYTLGPDLDPFLYLRNAIEMSNGIFDKIDSFRYAPLQMTPSYITYNLMPWSIYLFYLLLSIFTNISVTYTAIIIPVIFFIISSIGFFLFSKTISSFKFSENKSWIIATIATFFYVFIPSMLARTVAGIPELESLGMVWFWFTFLFIALAWREHKKSKQILFAILSGIFTGAMSWTWGGYRYIYLAIFLTTFIIFLFEKEKPKNRIIFSFWFLSAIILEILKVRNIISSVSSLSDTALCLFLLGIIWIDYVLFETKLKERIKLNKIKIPNSLKSLIVIIVIGIILGLIIKPDMVIEITTNLIDKLLYPFGRERIGLTVSENQVPYLTEVLGQFGNLFWLFFFGSIFLFYEAIKHFDIKKKIVLFTSFVFFICAFTFSRISSTSQILNGETILSKIFYLGGLFIFGVTLLGIYLISYRNKDEQTLQNFKGIDFSFLLLIVLSILMIVSLRGAIRLFFIVSPFLGLISAFLPTQVYDTWKNSKDSLIKMASIIALFVIVIMMIGTFSSYSASINYNAKSSVPSVYTQQWQYAMEWVRENTPEGSIFIHWWDYGYWVQTIGQRPTVTDGGHYIGYWNHLIARYLLTTHNQNIALSLMKSYNVSYLLIDSTDLGKYSAYSKIGGNNNYDTFSTIPIATIDKTKTQETENSTTMVYQVTGIVDEDISFNYDGKEIFIPGPTYDEYGEVSVKAYVIGIFLRVDSSNNFLQPYAIFYYNGEQTALPIRYLDYEGNLIDFKNGFDSTIQIIPSISVSSEGSLTFEKNGAAIYLSPKVSKSLFAQLYLLDDPYNKYSTLNLVHSEQSNAIKELSSKGYDVGEFVYYSGSLLGPIKIWNVQYPSNILIHEEFLQTDGDWAEFDNLKFTTD